MESEGLFIWGTIIWAMFEKNLMTFHEILIGSRPDLYFMPSKPFQTEHLFQTSRYGAAALRAAFRFRKGFSVVRMAFGAEVGRVSFFETTTDIKKEVRT